MSDTSINRLRILQQRMVEDSKKVLSRDDLVRLRMYWGDIQQILADEDRGRIE